MEDNIGMCLGIVGERISKTKTNLDESRTPRKGLAEPKDLAR